MNKYHNKKVTYNNITFDSKKERDYYIFFKKQEDEGLIHNLRLQVKYELLPAIYEEKEVQLKTKTKLVKKCIQQATNYIADFVYEKDGEVFVIDVKGIRTKEYLLKKKMMLSLLKIKIIEK